MILRQCCGIDREMDFLGYLHRMLEKPAGLGYLFTHESE